MSLVGQMIGRCSTIVERSYSASATAIKVLEATIGSKIAIVTAVLCHLVKKQAMTAMEEKSEDLN